MQGAADYHKLSDAGAALAGRFDRAHQPSLFDRFDWLDDLYRYCFPGQESVAVQAEVDSAEGWLFLTRTEAGRLSALANYYSFNWRPLFSGNLDNGTKRRLLRDMARRLARQESRIDLYPLIADDGSLDLVMQAFGAEGWITVARPMGTNHYLEVGSRSFADYWAGRSGALRSTVKRKSRQHPMDFRIHRQFDEQAWRDYEAIYAQSWKPEEGSMAFLRAIAEREGAAGTLRLGIAHYQGRPVAAQFWTVENGTALIHKLAHDSATDAASPGTLLSAHMFTQAIDGDKVVLIDYGTGDNAYKLDWMEQHRPLYRVDCFNARHPSVWPAAMKCKISRLVGHRGKR